MCIFFGTLVNSCCLCSLFTLIAHKKDATLVPWDSLSPADQNFLRDKYRNAGEGAICDLCVCTARPSLFFSCPFFMRLIIPPNQWILGCRCLRLL